MEITIFLGLLTICFVAGYIFALRGRPSTKAVATQAIKQSQAVITGRVIEEVIPWWPKFPYNPRDVHHLGQPVDYVIFEGLQGEGPISVVLADVKTGNAKLTDRQERIRDAIEHHRVRWDTVYFKEGRP